MLIMKKRLKGNVEFCLCARRCRQVNARYKGIESCLQEDFYFLFEFIGNVRGRGGGRCLQVTFSCSVVESNF